MLVATVLLCLALASHPELRLFVPLLDTLGLDLLVVLLGSQFLDFARPLAQRTAGAGYRAVVYLLGIAGPYLDGLARHVLSNATGGRTA